MSDLKPKFPPRPADAGAAGTLFVSYLPVEPPGPEPEPEPPARPARRLPGRRVLLAAAAVVLVVAAGAVWWVVAGDGGDDGAPPPAAQEAVRFQRLPVTRQAVLDSDCAQHSYGETKRYLAETPCQQLARALFSSTTEDGRTVYTAVAVVRMRDAEDAARLGDLVRQDDTGNVNDLLREGVVSVPGLPRLSRGGFAAEVRDREVVIAESDTPDPLPSEQVHRAEMKRISAEALRLGTEVR